jgi:hypothetical protein
MAKAKNFKRRGKTGKFKVGDYLYFKSPSSDRSRTYHYKQRINVNGKSSSTIQITKKKYENARIRKSKSKV